MIKSYKKLNIIIGPLTWGWTHTVEHTTGKNFTRYSDILVKNPPVVRKHVKQYPTPIVWLVIMIPYKEASVSLVCNLLSFIALIQINTHSFP